MRRWHGFVMAAGVVALLCGAARADEALRGEVERVLKQGLEAWFPRCLDREHGGFLCNFDFEWKPGREQPKTIVYQARQTWLAAQAMRRYPNDPRYREAAGHGGRFLRDVMWDAEHGGWYWALDRQGKPDPRWQGVKHAYGISFGIYACAAHFRATQDAQSLTGRSKPTGGWRSTPTTRSTAATTNSTAATARRSGPPPTAPSTPAGGRSSGRSVTRR